jgi:8-oxo-(d)GTP phosphatase
VASKPATIRAAGGVVHRDGLIALVHRPRYNDWSLPKGKLDEGEPPAAAAAREIAEETGARVALTHLLMRVTYPIDSMMKLVDYWQMRYLGGDFVPSSEVDQVEWLTPPEARSRLTYWHDRQVVDAAVRSRELDSVLVLVRHARAGSRSQWSGPDARRPLEESGHAQAELLAPLLAAFAPERIVSADRTRCVQTVEPLGKLIDLPIEQGARFGDLGYGADSKRSLASLYSMLTESQVIVLCSQGDAIPAMLHDLRCVPRSRPAKTRKGGAWVIGFAGGRAVKADYYRTPLSPR